MTLDNIKNHISVVEEDELEAQERNGKCTNVNTE